ncbi:NAD(P)-dependent alcohol dehydrogenase [Actinomadura scrupuli]|uniref:NAD(P)-dependent alcohol dehydrogenase n=1 Tax=Actinomadura scrupuli TaxID=559629 RepID=UPI003D975B81
MNITAAVLREPGGPFTLERLELAGPRPDEVIVRMIAGGVCHTDLVTADAGPPGGTPLVLGHEGAGIVETTGSSVTSIEPGDHVVLSYAWCGLCRNCGRGLMAYCSRFLALNYVGTRVDGSSAMSRDGHQVNGHFFGQSSWAGHTVTTERNVVRVPGDLPLEFLAPLGCGVQTGAGTVLNVLQPEPGSSIAVFGCGAVGLSAIMAAKIAGCGRIVAVDPNPRRRDLAVELGATDAVDPAAGDPAAAIRTLTGGVDHSVECVGLPAVVQAAVGCLAAPGTCVTVGFRGLANPVELDQVRLMTGRGIRGSIEGDAIPQRFIPQLAGYYRTGRLPLERLVRTYAFDQINEAVRASRDGEVVKPVLVFP